ncbi:MAG: sodium:solute symporter family protein [Saprospiraceae bacterium]|nr:sodium:solute symporter family protein [Saprospiraceae bacterium]
MTLTILAIYLAAQFGLGYYVSRRIQTEDDYLIGGRSLGMGLATFSIFATWFGAETCIGAAGRVYVEGLAGGTHDPFGYALCILFMGLFIAVPIWKLKLTTVGDLYKIRYGGMVERVASIIMIPTSLLWAAAQIRAFGQILSAISGVEVTFMITLAAAFIIAYTFLGGLLADAWTDLIQGIALLLGLMILGVALFLSNGSELWNAIPTSRFSLLTNKATLLDMIESWSVPILGSLVAAELITRAIASRTAATARRASIIAFLMYILIGVIPIFVGLIGPQVFSNLTHSEQILPLIAEKYLPHFLYVLFIGALLSAIISTVDSALLTCGSLTAHNILLPLLQDRKTVSETLKVKLARSSVVLYGLIAYIMALYAEGVYHLVEEASSFGSSGLVVVIFFALYAKSWSPLAAMLSLLGGVISYILSAHVIGAAHPFITSLLFAFVLYLIGDFLRPAKAPAPAGFRFIEPVE